MKSFLIKIGKAFSVLRRDGIMQGGKRVLGYLSLFLKTIFLVKPGEVLFITGGVGDSALYRTYNQAEELNLHKIKASVALQDSLSLVSLAKKFKIFIFHRTNYTKKIAQLIQEIKNQKKEIIFETDDLVFDAHYIQATDLYQNKMSSLEKMQYQTGVGEEILKDDYVKTCLTSSTYLAKILATYQKKVFITKNKISNSELEIIENILKQKRKSDDDYVKVGYFSGTNSHNKDFATIVEVLIDILEKYSQVQLILAGPLDIDSRLDKYKKRIIQLPFANRKKYWLNVFQSDIILAPLQVNNPFCDSKSELKFFEAGILKIPVVAVRNQTFSEAIMEGVDGFLASSPEEWKNKISRLVEDKELRKSIGEKAYQKVLQNYTNRNSHNEKYYNYLREILDN